MSNFMRRAWIAYRDCMLDPWNWILVFIGCGIGFSLRSGCL